MHERTVGQCLLLRKLGGQEAVESRLVVLINPSLALIFRNPLFFIRCINLQHRRFASYVSIFIGVYTVYDLG